MSYAKNNLLDNEIIVYEWKIHKIYLFFMLIWFLLGIKILLAWTDFYSFFGLWVVLMFIYQILYILTTEIVATNKRVLYKTWVISRNVFELQLNKVESAILNQTIFERIIWAWTLVISWTWWHNKPIVNLANPIKMRNIIYKSIENS